MLTKLVTWLLWLYWKANREFMAAFVEALFGESESLPKPDGKRIVARIEKFLAEATPTVFAQFVGTVALIPLSMPKRLPRSDGKRTVMRIWFMTKSFFQHRSFAKKSKEKQVAQVDKMFRRLIDAQAVQESDAVKSIVTLTLLKEVLAMAYLEQDDVWKAIDYKPFRKREWNPPTGPNLAKPPRSPGAELLHKSRQPVTEVNKKPAGKTTYCIIGSGAGGAMAAYTIQQKDKDARILLIESGPLFTNDMFTTKLLDSVNQIYMNAAVTLSKDEKFIFRQGRGVGGSTLVNNAIAFVPEGTWWTEVLVQRWKDMGVSLEWDKLYEKYGEISELLSVSPVDDRVIIEGARTIKSGWEKLKEKGALTDKNLLLHVKTNIKECIGCGRCNYGCQYDAKRSVMDTIIPEFVKNGGILVPDTDIDNIELERDGKGGFTVRSVTAHTLDGESVLIEADRFILAAGAYASTKLLLRSGYAGAKPGVTTVGTQFSVNFGAPVIGIFPERLDSFAGNQPGFVLQFPDIKMNMETGFGPPGATAMQLPAWGNKFQERIQKLNNMVVAVPVVASVSYGKIVPGILGDSGYVIDYTMNDEDWRHLESGMRVAAKSMFEMGAEEIFINRFDATSVKSADEVDDYFSDLGPNDFIGVESAHMQGGNPIARSPDRGVVDNDLKVFGVDNLWICDASVIPAPIGVNIAMTVMALSRYAAERIAVSGLSKGAAKASRKAEKQAAAG